MRSDARPFRATPLWDTIPREMANATGTPEASQPARRRPLLAASPRFADSFGLVLLLLIISYFVIAAAGDGNAGRVASMIIFATTTWLALRAAQVKRRILRVALALIPLGTAIAIILVLVGNDETATIVSKMLTILLVVVAPVAILKRLVAHPVISLNTFYGAVCVYLLIAMFFATTYGLIALLTDQQFFAQLTTAPKDTPAVDYLYFSFVTITTTGYGDLTAASSVGRMTAVMEAIFGQLYLITVVALVVQNLGQRSRMGRKMEEQLEEAGGGAAGIGDDDAGGADPEADDSDSA
jgi:voltage-gated potassium channel